MKNLGVALLGAVMVGPGGCNKSVETTPESRPAAGPKTYGPTPRDTMKEWKITEGELAGFTVHGYMDAVVPGTPYSSDLRVGVTSYGKLGNFEGKCYYRLVTAANPNPPWVEMNRGAFDGAKYEYSAHSLKPPPGRVAVHVRLLGDGTLRPTDLTDWAFDVP
jgi:hypothetical protein